MSTTESENKQRLKEYIAAWNDHDVDAIVAFISDESELSSRALREIPQQWFRAFPDLRHDIQEIAADDDWVLARNSFGEPTRGNSKAFRQREKPSRSTITSRHGSTRMDESSS